MHHAVSQVRTRTVHNLHRLDDGVTVHTQTVIMQYVNGRLLSSTISIVGTASIIHIQAKPARKFRLGEWSF